MYFKTIIQGRLSFANTKSYEKVVKMFEYRAETYYKSDVLLALEDIFNRESLTLTVPRYVGNASDKSFKNTVNLLEYCAQFAVSGSIDAWMIDEGKVIQSREIQPQSDKAAVQQFLKGDKLFGQAGKESEAIEAFNKTLETYEKHAQAYERRGYVNLHLRNYSDALYDFNKAIKLDDSIAYAYYGKAIIARHENNLEEAIVNFEHTLKKSVALQSLYWKARLRKSMCHIELEQWDKADFDLKFFTNRKFKEGSKNDNRKAQAFSLYGKVLYEKEEFDKALSALDRAVEIHHEDSKGFDLTETLFLRGLVKKELGKKDAMVDINKAAKAGLHEAVEYVAANG